VITIFEIDATGQRNWAKAVYNFQWTPQTDPSGVVHKTIDYPGDGQGRVWFAAAYGSQGTPSAVMSSGPIDALVGTEL
jgi:hypothetical protein